MGAPTSTQIFAANKKFWICFYVRMGEEEATQ